MCTSRNRDATEVLVRINPLSTDIWKEDIEVGFLGNVDGFMIPKVESQDELIMLDETLSELESKQSTDKRKIILPIATETPNAVLNIASIAKSPRVAAITWVSFFVISCVTIICICCAFICNIAQLLVVNFRDVRTCQPKWEVLAHIKLNLLESI